jgi:uncharacterized protein YcbK (DUF882 family)
MKKKRENLSPKGERAAAIDRNMVWKDIGHFKPKEFTCNCQGLCDHQDLIDPELVVRLDRIRERIGKPIRITSGARCPRHNRKVGGAPLSAHLPLQNTSYAADIFCPDNLFRREFLAGAIPLFPRIGVGKDFIHVDLHPELPQNVLWVY